ncbi:MAG: SRPBCC family protein [Methylococcales bacterium]|jgi:hypothetical protein|nr:SRPBCC family protein [Methylococcales bacterium]
MIITIVSILIFLIILIAVIYLIGSKIKPEYSAYATTTISKELKTIWDFTTDFKNTANWSDYINKVEILNDPRLGDEGKITWLEHYDNFIIKLECTDYVDYEYTEVLMLEPDLVAGTSWRIEFKAIDSSSTNVSIKISGQIKNNFLRFFKKLFNSYDRDAQVMLEQMKNAVT